MQKTLAEIVRNELGIDVFRAAKPKQVLTVEPQMAVRTQQFDADLVLALMDTEVRVVDFAEWEAASKPARSQARENRYDYVPFKFAA